MAAITGVAAYVKWGANTVGLIGKWSLDLGQDTPEITSFSSAGWKEFIAGIKEWSVSFEGSYDRSDAAQAAALVSMTSTPATATTSLYENATKYYSGTVILKGAKIEVDASDVESISFDGQGSGVLAYT